VTKTYQPVKDSEINYLVDTGPLVATLNKNDTAREWSVNTLRALGETFHTTDAVITEVCYQLRNGRHALPSLFDAIRVGKINVCAIFPEASERVNVLMQKYPQMDFADASLVALSEQHPHARLVTIDRRDFTVYRRHDGSLVPCIMPQVY